MTLKTNVFLWVFLATAVPIFTLTLYATSYSENLYLADVHRDIGESLGNVASEIRRRMLLERELLEGLTLAPILRDFIPVLNARAEDKQHPESLSRIQRLEDFLESFQTIIPSMSDLRILDAQGNTLVMVKSGRHSQSFMTDPQTLTYVEEPVDDNAFTLYLKGLAPNEFGYTLLPQDAIDAVTLEHAPVFDTVLALGETQHTVGYLIAKVRRDPIDRVLHVTPRLYKGKLLIAEINSDDPQRDGLILYDDSNDITLGSDRLGVEKLWESHPDLYNTAQLELFGYLDSPNGEMRTYYAEFLPYSDQFLSWVVATRIDLSNLSAPFQRIRIAIIAFALLSLLGSLLIARLGASRIARPVMDLAGKLSRYAKDERQLRVKLQGPKEIQRAGTAFNDMAETLEEAERERDQAQATMLQQAKLASLGQLAAGIGHEINNPINNVLSLSKLIERSLSDDDQHLRKDVTSVREEALRASRIVNAILNFARQVPPEYSLFEVEPWLQETLALLKQEALERGVSLKLDLEAQYLLEGDRDLLEQTLINLLLNALQATPQGSSIDIVVTRHQQELEISVYDQGPGISANEIGRVFDPFFTTKPTGQGSGLGLSLSLGIVERHGGRLHIQNRSPGGVKATIILPRVVEIAEHAMNTPPREPLQ
ncbi:MAG: HAMP domain-containing sensor histidine kinase [Pseudomonadota bacterium]